MEQQHQPVTQTKYGIVAPTRNPNQTELLGMEQHLPVSQTKPNNFIQHVNLYLGSGSRGRDTSWSSMWRNEATWCAGLNYVSLPELNVPARNFLAPGALLYRPKSGRTFRRIFRLVNISKH